jgi:hypothetical protein
MSKYIAIWGFRGRVSHGTERCGRRSGAYFEGEGAEARACDILRSESTLADWTVPVMPFSTPNSGQWMHEQYVPSSTPTDEKKIASVSIARHSYGRIFTPSCLANREPETTPELPYHRCSERLRSVGLHTSP